MNKKSDVKAKAAYKNHLENSGYNDVRVVASPADIIAQKNGQTFYFEIKMTKRKEVYFGAATLTEWVQAFKTPDHFKFVIAKTDDLEEAFEFREYSPAEFMQHSTIPPFKIFFNVNLNGETKVKARTKAVPLNKETMDLMIEVYDKIREI